MKETHCEGCEEGITPDPERQTTMYRVTFRHSTEGHVTKRVRWCEECYDLARVDWSGTVEQVHPIGERVS